MNTKITVELIPDIFLILFVIALSNDCVLSDFTFTKILITDQLVVHGAAATVSGITIHRLDHRSF
jgi:hypothetical protein